MVYLDEPYVRVEWDEKLRCVLQIWKGFADSKQYRSAMEKTLDLAKEKKARRWLIDLRTARVISLDDQDWSAKEFVPRAYAIGWNQHAIVVPKDVLSQMALNRVKTKADSPGVEYFEEIEAAREWLLSR